MMTGIFIGARNSSLLKLSIKWDCFPIRELIILETGMKFVERIYYLKMLKSIRERLRNKPKINKPPLITSCPWLITCLANTPSFWNSLKKLQKTNAYGLWNPSARVKAKEYFYSRKLVKLRNGPNHLLHLSPTLYRDISMTHCW